MKKFLGIMVLGLLFCSNSFAGEMNLWKKKFKLPTDVMQGYKNSWNFCCNYDRKTHRNLPICPNFNLGHPSKRREGCGALSFFI